MDRPASPNTGRILAIGDIHGHNAALEALLASVKVTKEDTMITLGDYVNRGPDSRGVIETLLKLGTECHLIPLRGNHEVMTLEARRSNGAFYGWLECGGDDTLRSYGVEYMKDIPESHWAFFNSCRRYHETGKNIFVHASLDPSLPMENQFDGDLFWKPLPEAAPHVSGKVMICGHTPQRSGLPANLGFAICIDTDVNRAGWLTCLEPLTGRYWQARSDGATRDGFLEEPSEVFTD